MSNFKSFLRRPKFGLLSTLLIFSGLVAIFAQPAWWGDDHASDPADPTNYDIPAVLNGNQQNNHGPANIGQAKHMAKSALLELRKIGQIALADDIEGKLTVPQSDPANTSDTYPAVLDFSVPADPKPADWLVKQKSPLLIGQLKAIVGPFYDALNTIEPAWLETQLTENQTKDTANPTNHYPWTATTTDDQNNAIANIGQLKAVFSLKFETLPSEFIDEDWDGMADNWELKNGLDPTDWVDSYEDSDGDGIINLHEYLLGFNPWSDSSNNTPDKDRDRDHDGMPDAWEITFIVSDSWDEVLQRYTDVRRLDWEVDDAAQDPDVDGLSNLAEFLAGTNPFDCDSDGDHLPDAWEILHGFVAASSIQINGTWVSGYYGENGSNGDPDGDGIQNQYEYVLGFDPHNANTNGTSDFTKDRDADGMKDWQEAATGNFNWNWEQQEYLFIRFLDWEAADANEDFDQDGLTNALEFLNGTDPSDYDSDGDYLPDVWEIQHGLVAASSIQINGTWVSGYYGENGSNGDPDGDGIQNQYEYILGFDPKIANTNGTPDATKDRDADGIPDAWEASTGFWTWDAPSQQYVFTRKLDWETADSTADPDGDDLTNLQEFQNETDPWNSDTDGDRMPDGWEIANGFNPCSPNATQDSDNDGLTDLEEYLVGTNPHNSDTDGDGELDGVEYALGKNPNDISDGGQPPPNDLVDVPFKVYGDYASWEMTVQPISGSGGKTEKVTTAGIGSPGIRTLKLKKSVKYKATLKHTGTRDAPGKPWFCWEAKIDKQPSAQTFPSYKSTRNAGVAEFFVIGEGHWIVDNRPGLFTSHIDQKTPDSGNVAGGLEAILIPVEIVPDYNRDGKIDQADRGKVTEQNPWRWWINDDNDLTTAERGNNLQDIPDQQRQTGFGIVDDRDCIDLAVDGMCDLIDFFPLHLDLKAALEILPDSDYKYVLKHEDEALKFYEYPTCVVDGSEEGKEPNQHVKNVGVGRALAFKALKLTSTQGSELTSNMLANLKKGKGVVVIEGAKNTQKPLVLKIIKKSDGRSILQINFPICIGNVEDMFRHVNMRDLAGGSGGFPTQTNDPTDYPDHLTNGKYIAYVHGYYISGESSRGSQSNLFKRFHQLGSNARFIGISWYGDPPNPGLQWPLPPDFHQATYNGLISSISAKVRLAFTHGSDLTILAHSLGNSLVSNAIANYGLNVGHYYIVNGAIPLQAYDASQTENSSNHPDMSRNMTEDDWKPFYDYGGGSQQRLFAANWHELFAATPTDKRNQLTWKNFFAKPQLLSVAYNFYSPSDEVVENARPSEEFGSKDNLYDAIELTRHAWVLQEIAKGGQNKITYGAIADLNGGWQFNFNTAYFAYGSPFQRRYTPAEAATLYTNEYLQTTPYHRRFLFPDLYDPALGSVTAGITTNKYKLLATGIPATSYAIAANNVPKLNKSNGGEERNFNMPDTLKSPSGAASWPAHEHAKAPGDWMHSDFKDVAFQFVWPLYQKMIDLAELNQPPTQ